MLCFFNRLYDFARMQENIWCGGGWNMKHFKQIIAVLVLLIPINALAEESILDSEYYVSELSCNTEVVAINDHEASMEVINQDTVVLPNFVVTCNVDDSFMVSLSE